MTLNREIIPKEHSVMNLLVFLGTIGVGVMAVVLIAWRTDAIWNNGKLPIQIENKTKKLVKEEIAKELNQYEEYAFELAVPAPSLQKDDPFAKFENTDPVEYTVKKVECDNVVDMTVFNKFLELNPSLKSPFQNTE